LRAAVEESGLVVHEHPLMVLGHSTPVPGVETLPDELPDGLLVRIIGPSDPTLPSALAVAHLAFAEPGPGSVSRAWPSWPRRCGREPMTDPSNASPPVSERV
jgi:hypothetical protein